MSRRVVVALLAGTALSFSVALARPPAAEGGSASPDGSPHGSPPGEMARIRAHLADVERELLARDVSGLTPAQRAARARHIAVLRTYRERGIFPHNHDFAGERVPYFVDEHGTRCAMAHLIEQSGRGDLVARVAASANNARVPELAGDSALVAWLDANGLTLAEAARVQPAYDGGVCLCIPDPEPTPARMTARYGTASAVASGTALAALVWNLRGDPGPERSTARRLAALAAGVAALWVGTSQFDERGSPLAVGAVNAAVGTATAAVAAHRLLRSPTPVAPVPTASMPPAGERGYAVSLSPHVEPRSGVVGVRVGLTF